MRGILVRVPTALTHGPTRVPAAPTCVPPTRVPTAQTHGQTRVPPVPTPVLTAQTHLGFTTIVIRIQQDATRVSQVEVTESSQVA